MRLGWGHPEDCPETEAETGDATRLALKVGTSPSTDRPLPAWLPASYLCVPGRRCCSLSFCRPGSPLFGDSLEVTKLERCQWDGSPALRQPRPSRWPSLLQDWEHAGSLGPGCRPLAPAAGSQRTRGPALPICLDWAVYHAPQGQLTVCPQWQHTDDGPSGGLTAISWGWEGGAYAGAPLKLPSPSSHFQAFQGGGHTPPWGPAGSGPTNGWPLGTLPPKAKAGVLTHLPEPAERDGL